MTYVLVHGGGSTGRFWDRLAPLLDGPALAVDLPGRAGKPADLATLSVEQEVASVVADVLASVPADDAFGDDPLADTQGGAGPLILVAHSSGGLVVPGVVAALAAAGSPVAHVVLNAALVPPEGGCGLDTMKPHHRDGLLAALAAADADGTPITLPGPPADPESFRSAYGGEPLDDDALAFVTDPARCVPDTVHHYRQPVRWAPVADVAVTYVVNDRDRPVNPAQQADAIAHLDAVLTAPPTVVHLDSGHLPAVTDPAALAEILATVLAAVRVR